MDQGGGGGGGGMLPPGNFLDFNSLMSHFLGFSVTQTGNCPNCFWDFNLEFSFIKKIYLLWKIWPISIKQWKPVWICCCGWREALWEQGCALREITRSPKFPNCEIQGAQHKAYMKEIRLSGSPKAKVSRLRDPGTLRAQPWREKCLAQEHSVMTPAINPESGMLTTKGHCVSHNYWVLVLEITLTQTATVNTWV